MNKFYKMLFLNSLIFSTILAISSYSWFTMWVGLEVNMLSFIPLMTGTKNAYPAEAALKYFMAQTLASNILIFSIVMLMQFSTQLNFEFNAGMKMILNSTLFMKLGAAPFHYWLPEVISGLDWINSFILLTWQKVAPMALIMNNLSQFHYLSVIAMISLIMGGLENLNQTDLRKILAYSSINHIGWMLASMINSSNIWLIYFVTYSMITLNIVLFLKIYKVYNLYQLMGTIANLKLSKFLFMMNFLSLGGLPPFFGFMPKWLTLNNLIMNEFYFLSFIMVISTLINMYVYLRMTFTSLTLTTKESLIYSLKPFPFWFYFYNLISLAGLIFILMINLF